MGAAPPPSLWQCSRCKATVEVDRLGCLVEHCRPDQPEYICEGSGSAAIGPDRVPLGPADLAVVARIVRTCAGQAYNHILTSMLVALNQAAKPPETELRDPLMAYSLGYRRGVADALESAKRGKESFQV